MSVGCRVTTGVHLRELVSEVLQTVSAGAGPTALAAQKAHGKMVMSNFE